MTDKILHPVCRECGWRKGGADSWNGRACKCGFSAPPISFGAVIDGEIARGASPAIRTNPHIRDLLENGE